MKKQYSVDELLKMNLDGLPQSRMGIRKRVESQKWPYVEVNGKGGRNGKRREYIKPRWPVAAWQVDEAEASVSVPASVILQISGSRSVKQRANGVFVQADHAKGKGADVFRKGTDREPRAGAVTGLLYTDLPVLDAAGTAALSDTGTHKTETVTLPVSAKYALPLAVKGQIWQVQEPSGTWQGVVTGVTLTVEMDNDAPRVQQAVVLDRYLDD